LQKGRLVCQYQKRRPGQGGLRLLALGTVRAIGNGDGLQLQVLVGFLELAGQHGRRLPAEAISVWVSGHGHGRLREP